MGVAKGILSRNPNICASCSSLADGMDEPSIASIQSDSGQALAGAQPSLSHNSSEPATVAGEPRGRPCPQGA